MRHFKGIRTLTLLMLMSLTLIGSVTSGNMAAGSTDNLVIKGLISNPLDLTYQELKSFPMVSEIAELRCVYAPSGTPYNWTGIPVFYLLKLANVKAGAKEVVFRSEDDFSSSLTLDEALHPTTILALRVNSTPLPEKDNYWAGGLAGGYPYKLVAPCRWGYKWVGWINEIEVVDYDYKGFYESSGFSDEAEIPNCTRLHITTPPYTEIIARWRHTQTVTVLSNATVLNAGFNQTVKRIYLTISSNSTSESFVSVIVPKRLLTTNFTVTLGNTEIGHTVMQGVETSLLYFTLTSSMQNIEIAGMLLADVTGQRQNVADGKVDMRDIAVVARHFETKAGDSEYVVNYDFNNDENIDSKDIDIATESFGKILP